MCVRDDSAAVASIPDIFKGTHQRFYYLRRSGLRYGKLSCATRIDVGRRQMGFLHLDGGQLASVDLDVAYVGLHALRFERMGAPSDQSPVACRQHIHGLSGFAKDDRRILAKLVCGRAFWVASPACGVRGLGG